MNSRSNYTKRCLLLLFALFLLLLCVATVSLAQKDNTDENDNDFWSTVNVVTEQLPPQSPSSPNSPLIDDVNKLNDIVMEVKKKPVKSPPKAASDFEEFDEQEDESTILSQSSSSTHGSSSGSSSDMNTPPPTAPTAIMDDYHAIMSEQEKRYSEEKKKRESEPIRVFSFPQQDHFYFEFACMGVLTLFFINFIVGRTRNNRLLSLWAKNHVTLFSDQFSNINRHILQKENPGLPFNANSLTEYYMYCTGRQNIDQGCMVTIDLKKRHDLLYLLMGLITSKVDSSDAVTLDIALTDLEPCVFALVSKHLESTFESECKDISHLCSKYYISKDSEKFPASKVVFTDSTELKDLSNRVMSEIMAQLKKYEDLLEAIYFSYDNNSIYPEHNKNLRVILKLPTSEDQMERLSELTSVIFNIVDMLPKLKLENKQREANLSARRKFKEEQAKRIEKLKQEKLEKLKKEKEQQEKTSVQELRKRSTKGKDGKKPKVNLVYS